MRNRLRRNKADFEGVGSNRNSHPSDKEPVGFQVLSQVELDNMELEIAAFEGRRQRRTLILDQQLSAFYCCDLRMKCVEV